MASSWSIWLEKKGGALVRQQAGQARGAGLSMRTAATSERRARRTSAAFDAAARCRAPLLARHGR